MTSKASKGVDRCARSGRTFASLVSLAAGLFITTFVAAQPAPMLSGLVDIDLSTGRIAGDVCIGGAPTAGDSVTIVLNAALAIEETSGTPPVPVGVEMEPGNETVRYTFAGITSRRTSAGTDVTDLCLTYAGRQTVYETEAGEYRDDDGSNIIAFNGNTLRARGAARWYPVPFDSRRGIALEAAAFDLEIRCRLCESIYVNGGDPVEGPSARFQSPQPRELMIVAGRLPVTVRPLGRIIGETVAPDTADLFLAELSAMQSFLADYVGVPYGPAPDIVRIAPVRRPWRGRVWGFFSDPALTLIGMDPGGFLRGLNGTNPATKRSLTAFLSHELAHRYFGWSFGVESPQRDLFGEPFATYLEMKAVRHFLGEGEYLSSLRRLMGRGTEAEERTPLSRSTPEDYAINDYRYGYAPLMLFALENVIGEVAMSRVLRIMIEAPPEERASADLEFIGRAVLSAGVPENRWRDFLDVCQTSPQANPCLEWIRPVEGELHPAQIRESIPLSW